MKTLKEYITESFDNKKYEFKIKIAGDVTSEYEDKIKSLLEKFGVDKFSKTGTTPIQGLPLDFPTLRNVNVNIFDATLNYPTTQFELHEYLSSGCGLAKNQIVVRSPFEPSEQYQEEATERKGALLDDPDYKELPKINTDDYYGTTYNQSLLKELAKDSKARAKARDEKIPAEGDKSAPEYEGKGSTSPISGKK